MENINIDKSNGFIKLTPKQGFLITTYKEGDDIKLYYSTTEVDAPMTADVSIYHTVILEQDEIYQKEKSEAIKNGFNI